MSIEVVTARVTHIIAGVLNVNYDEISPTSDIIDDLGAESMDQIEIACCIEDHYDEQGTPIELPDDDELMKLRKVGDIAARVQQELAKHE